MSRLGSLFRIVVAGVASFYTGNWGLLAAQIGSEAQRRKRDKNNARQRAAYNAALQAPGISERERTVRVGDVANDHMWTSNAAFDAIVETTVAKTLAKLGVKPKE